MDAPLYDIYLTGKLADNVAPEQAAQRLAALFKSTPAAMAGLITGKPQLLKRGVDKNTALKYREALQKAGCEVAFKAQVVAVANEQPTAQPAAATTTAAAPTPATAPLSGLQLAPAGEDLLRADERHVAAAVAVQTTHLSLAPVSPLPPVDAPAVVAPDISHLSLAAAGGTLLSESERQSPPPITPDIGELSVAELGAPIDMLKNDVVPLHPDTSGLNLAPVGSDVLTAEQRERPPVAAPNTDHIKLAP